MQLPDERRSIGSERIAETYACDPSVLARQRHQYLSGRRVGEAFGHRQTTERLDPCRTSKPITRAVDDTFDAASRDRRHIRRPEGWVNVAAERDGDRMMRPLLQL